MAVNSITATLISVPSLTTSTSLSFPSLDSQTTLDPLPDTFDVPYSDTFQVSVEGSETLSSQQVSIAADADQMAPKQKIRIKLRSFWVKLIEDSCKQIMDAARTTNAKTMGPVPLPTKKRVYCVLKSPPPCAQGCKRSSSEVSDPSVRCWISSEKTKLRKVAVSFKAMEANESVNLI
ncbi:hypothetical protein OIU76_019546 [Salix suchowensis]|nr:hypothetical protein OIU76_019546 [Salix suchowensis]